MSEAYRKSANLFHKREDKITDDGKITSLKNELFKMAILGFTLIIVFLLLFAL